MNSSISFYFFLLFESIYVSLHATYAFYIFERWMVLVSVLKTVVYKKIPLKEPCSMKNIGIFFSCIQVTFSNVFFIDYFFIDYRGRIKRKKEVFNSIDCEQRNLCIILQFSSNLFVRFFFQIIIGSKKENHVQR